MDTTEGMVATDILTWVDLDMAMDIIMARGLLSQATMEDMAMVAMDTEAMDMAMAMGTMDKSERFVQLLKHCLKNKINCSMILT